MTFSELGLDPALARGVEAHGYTEPTPIQTKAIPLVLSGSDLIGCAETGTGKTAAFLLPLIQRMNANPRPGARLLVLAPTRELASQIEASYKKYATKKSPRCALIMGGASMSKQLDGLRRGAGVIIATPGRLLEHLERGSFKTEYLEALVLDEADRMLDLGFWPSIKRIISMLPAKRQTLLFSATMPYEIEKLAYSTMKDPQTVEVSRRGKTAITVEQIVYPVATESKTALLLDLLEREADDLERVLVFTRTRRGAERLSHILQARDHSANRIHSDRTQSQREAALRSFKRGQTRVLVATDIAARGIDIDSVSHVINYDIPTAPEDYVHRIGRTGRAGKAGRAFTLVTPVDEPTMRSIERLTGQTLERVLLPAFGGELPKPAAARPSVPFKGKSSTTRSFRPRRGR
jgi:ATP-dependent RNA helicase RhlE